MAVLVAAMHLLHHLQHFLLVDGAMPVALIAPGRTRREARGQGNAQDERAESR
jgi:hypothetical protein